MNKKLLFGLMSLAALAACTNDDFDSQQVAEGTSPIQFEVINNNASMRASMDGNTVEWSAADGDLFTLYHGAAYSSPAAVTGYQNATYKANANEGGVATLTTPSVILEGSAIMVWPVDTTFSIKTGDKLSIKIPAVQGGKDEKGKDIIQYQIPYVSDLIQIQPYAAYTETAPATAYNTAGKDRKYSVYMRPMASQLNLTAEYAGSDAKIAELYEGAAGVDAGEGIAPIAVTSVDLLTTAAGTTKFTTRIPLQFAAPTGSQGSNWATKAPNHAWTQVTDFNVGGINPADQVAKLTTKHLFAGNTGGKFLILPQANIGAAGVAEGAVVVNTNYGKVIVAPTTFATNKGRYSATEIANAWYRYAAAGAGAGTYAEAETTIKKGGSGNDANYVRYTNNIALGLAQVIDAFSKNTAATGSTVVGEPTGAKGTRYVKVLLQYLDMRDLHVKTDKQLRDAAKVWKKMGLPSVTVYLDGNDPTDVAGKFEISQKTIKKINEINAAAAAETSPRAFTVMPCQTPKEVCKEIVITGADTEAKIQDIAFIKKNGVATAKVVLANETTAWKWNGTGTTTATKKVLVGEGVERIINKGTMVNDATATLATWSVSYNPTTGVMTVSTQSDVTLQNDGKWDIKGSSTVLNVQFDVENNGTVNIAEGAQYRQDGTGHTFNNLATTRPARFLADPTTEQVAVVNNNGVFATVDGGTINNYGLIEHLKKDAKTYITKNEELAPGKTFADGFAPGTVRMGRINLKYENKDEDNISISASAPITEGFVSITITEKDGEDDLKTSLVANSFVNYIIVNGGVKKISDLDTKIKYVEINQPGTEMVWNLSAAANYDGLIILSPVNIKLGQNISAKVTYLGADMYVGGTFNKAGTDWDGYYGITSGNVATKYITF